VPDVDVVVVSYNSRDHLVEAVAPFLDADDIDVVVVDNASPTESLSVLDGLPVHTIALERNGGFAHGCNVGWRSGTGRYVLLLNPDATMAPDAVRRLVRELDEHPEAGAAAPRIVEPDGELDLSLRRFPRLRSTFAQALFLHRVFPEASWTDEVVRDHDAYTQSAEVDWVSGACVLLRRSTLEEIGGLDEEYFHYCEDIDLCRSIWAAGKTIRYVPDAVAVHEGGASAPRTALLPVLAAARIRYARKHRGRVGAELERAGVALGALTHVAVSAGGRPARAGHLRALRVALRPSRSARV
jgi:N-acetylglucosaminyl-diphospho-decaprenol L-rhamnosyltransferase